MSGSPGHHRRSYGGKIVTQSYTIFFPSRSHRFVVPCPIRSDKREPLAPVRILRWRHVHSRLLPLNVVFQITVLELSLLQLRLNDVTDGNDALQPFTVHDGQMANPIVSHDSHYIPDFIFR